MITISIATLWLYFKWAGVVLFALSVLAFLFGDLPGVQGSGAANTLRVIVWPAFVLWLVYFLIRGVTH